MHVGPPINTSASQNVNPPSINPHGRPSVPAQGPPSPPPNPNAFQATDSDAHKTGIQQKQEKAEVQDGIAKTSSQSLHRMSQQYPTPSDLTSGTPSPETPPPTPPSTTTTPPPRLSDSELSAEFRSQLFQSGQINVLNEISRFLPLLAKGVEQAPRGVEVVEKTLEETLNGLDKRQKAYNAPLYRLADALGLKDRKVKLQQLSDQREKAIQSSQAVLEAHQINLESGQEELAKSSAQLRQKISEAHTEGQAFVKANQGNQGLMWRLGLHSQSSLVEALTPGFIEKLPNSEELLAKYSELQQTYATQKDNFKTLVARFSTEIEPRIKAYETQKKQLQKDSPEKVAAFRAAFIQELAVLSAPLLPLAKSLGIPKILQGETGSEYLHPQFLTLFEEFPHAPPSLFSVLPPEHQAYLNSMAQGMLSAMPNRVLDDSSIEIGGQKYINKTKIGEATMAVVYTYEHPDDPNQKIVVKVPKSDGLTAEQFQEKVLDESVRELENHYHAMGETGQGNPHLVSLVGTISTPQGPLIAMELVDKQDCMKLFAKMHGRVQENTLPPEDQQTVSKYMVYQMMQGLEYMHARGMTHLDVKADNFFIQSDGTVKVADFGLSKTQAQFSAQRHDFGDNSAHTPPEAHFDATMTAENATVQVGTKYDSWSVGAMMHSLLLGEPHRLVHPSWPSHTAKNTLEFGKDPNNRIILNPTTPLEHLINQLMHPDPQQRLSMSEALKDPFFNDLFEGAVGDRAVVKPEVQALIVRELAA